MRYSLKLGRGVPWSWSARGWCSGFTRIGGTWWLGTRCFSLWSLWRILGGSGLGCCSRQSYLLVVATKHLSGFHAEPSTYWYTPKDPLKIILTFSAKSYFLWACHSANISLSPVPWLCSSDRLSNCLSRRHPISALFRPSRWVASVGSPLRRKVSWRHELLFRYDFYFLRIFSHRRQRRNWSYHHCTGLERRLGSDSCLRNLGLLLISTGLYASRTISIIYSCFDSAPNNSRCPAQISNNFVLQQSST